METNYELILNTSKKRFEMIIDNHVSFVDYIINDEKIMFLTHTEVPKILEGKGIGSALIEKVLNHIKNNNYTLAPLCPFIAKYITKHSNWKLILAKGYNV